MSLTLDGQEDKIPSFNEVYYCRCEEQEKNDSTELRCTLEIYRNAMHQSEKTNCITNYEHIT